MAADIWNRRVPAQPPDAAKGEVPEGMARLRIAVQARWDDIGCGKLPWWVSRVINCSTGTDEHDGESSPPNGAIIVADVPLPRPPADVRGEVEGA